MAMNPEIKAQWQARLRDPEAKQTNGVLCRTEPVGEQPAGMCCLGVLTELAVEAGVAERYDAIDGGSVVVYGPPRAPGEDVPLGTETWFLPTVVVKWAGLDSENPTVSTPDGLRTSLSDLNDHGSSFAEIADFVEQL